MSPTSPQQVVVVEFGKRHDTTGTTDFCPRQLVTDLLWGSYGEAIAYGETGVMDFGKTCYGEVTNLLRTCYGETSAVDFGLKTSIEKVIMQRQRQTIVVA